MKMISILGDSVSTYEGYNPSGYAVFYDNKMAAHNGLNSVYDTWWAKVNQQMKAYLCVNNSYSGSRVSGEDFSSASSDVRIMNLRTETKSPDFILVYIGFNDFGNGIPIGGRKFFGRERVSFAASYDNMLCKMKAYYPNAEIICATLMRTAIKDNETWEFPEEHGGVPFAQYNDVIRKVCRRRKVHLTDLDSLNVRYETLDGSHPTAKGHEMIAECWYKCLEKTNYI